MEQRKEQSDIEVVGQIEPHAGQPIVLRQGEREDMIVQPTQTLRISLHLLRERRTAWDPTVTVNTQ
jgi:hypothetical protein